MVVAISIRQSLILRYSVLAVIAVVLCLLTFARMPDGLAWIVGGVFVAVMGMVWRQTLGAGLAGELKRSGDQWHIEIKGQTDELTDVRLGLVSEAVISAMFVGGKRYRALLLRDALTAHEHWQLRRWLLDGALTRGQDARRGL